MQQVPALTQPARLRITRRGRAVLTVLVTLAVATALSIAAVFGATQAQASPEQPAGEPVVFSYVVALPGDSFWSLASRIAPEADPREVIADIQRLNQLESSDLVIGQELAVPHHWVD